MFKDNKAQAIAYDVSIAFFIFIIIFGALSVLWFNTLEASQDERDVKHMKDKTFQLNDQFARNRGQPVDWQVDYNNVQVIGFASGRGNVLDVNKVESFLQLDYQASRDILGIPDFNYLWKITEFDGTVLKQKGVDTAGLYEFTSTRVVNYAGEDRLMTFKLVGSETEYFALFGAQLEIIFTAPTSVFVVGDTFDTNTVTTCRNLPCGDITVFLNMCPGDSCTNFALLDSASAGLATDTANPDVNCGFLNINGSCESTWDTNALGVGLYRFEGVAISDQETVAQAKTVELLDVIVKLPGDLRVDVNVSKNIMVVGNQFDLNATINCDGNTAFACGNFVHANGEFCAGSGCSSFGNLSTSGDLNTVDINPDTTLCHDLIGGDSCTPSWVVGAETAGTYVLNTFADSTSQAITDVRDTTPPEIIVYNGILTVDVTSPPNGSSYIPGQSFDLNAIISCEGSCGFVTEHGEFCSGSGCTSWSDLNNVSGGLLTADTNPASTCGILNDTDTCTVTFDVDINFTGVFRLNVFADSNDVFVLDARDPTPPEITVSTIPGGHTRECFVSFSTQSTDKLAFMSVSPDFNAFNVWVTDIDVEPTTGDGEHNVGEFGDDDNDGKFDDVTYVEKNTQKLSVFHLDNNTTTVTNFISDSSFGHGDSDFDGRTDDITHKIKGGNDDGKLGAYHFDLGTLDVYDVTIKGVGGFGDSDNDGDFDDLGLFGGADAYADNLIIFHFDTNTFTDTNIETKGVGGFGDSDGDGRGDDLAFLDDVKELNVYHGDTGTVTDYGAGGSVEFIGSMCDCDSDFVSDVIIVVGPGDKDVQFFRLDTNTFVDSGQAAMDVGGCGEKPDWWVDPWE